MKNERDLRDETIVKQYVSWQDVEDFVSELAQKNK